MLIFIFLICLGVFPMYGQEPAPQRVGVGLVEHKLTIKEAIEMALVNNLDIEIERTNRSSAQTALRGTRGFYDPNFRWVPGLELRNMPTASVLIAPSGKLTEHLHTEQLSYRQLLPWAGQQLAGGFDNSRQSTTNPFSSLSPFVTSRLFFSFSQPLVRNRVIDPQRAEIRIRQKQVSLSETELETKVIGVVVRVQQAYWSLAAARKDTDVRADFVKWGREQLARNQRMIAAGTLAPVELSASEAELQRRLDMYYSSLDTITEVENILKALLTPNREASLWSEQIIPVEDKTLSPPEVVDLRETVTSALKARPELRALSSQEQINQIQKQQAADQVKPQLNLVLSYVANGLGGTAQTGPNPISASNAALYDRVNQLSGYVGLDPLTAPSYGGAPPTMVGGLGTSLENLFLGRYQSFQAGLALDLNIRNNAAQANLAQTVIAERKLKLQQAQLEQLIEIEVRNALQAVQTARQRIAATEASARAAKEKLDSEIRLFQTGESTNFMVLTRQSEYADSRHRAVVANLDLNRAVVRLQQAVGSTLQGHGITVR